MVVTLLITDAMLQTVVDEVVEVELLVDVVDDDQQRFATTQLDATEYIVPHDEIAATYVMVFVCIDSHQIEHLLLLVKRWQT